LCLDLADPLSQRLGPIEQVQVIEKKVKGTPYARDKSLPYKGVLPLVIKGKELSVAEMDFGLVL